MGENPVGLLRRKQPLSLQHIMEMWLGDPRQPGQAALRDLPTVDALPKMLDQLLLQAPETRAHNCGYISGRNRGVLDLIIFMFHYRKILDFFANLIRSLRYKNTTP